MKSACLGVLAVLVAVSASAQSRGTRPTPAKAPAATSVRVTVRDTAGNGVAEARLMLSGDGSGEFTTGGAGTAMLPDLKDGTYLLHVEHKGFVTLEREFVIQRGAPKALELALAAAPAPPPPPPAPAPTPAKAALPPPGAPVTVSVVDFLEHNLIGKEPMSESVLDCAALETVRLVQIREGMASHSHNDADEVIYVIAGEGMAKVDDQTIALKPGVLVVAPRTRAHSFERRGKNPLMLLSTLAGAPCHESVASK